MIDDAFCQNCGYPIWDAAESDNYAFCWECEYTGVEIEAEEVIEPPWYQDPILFEAGGILDE